MLSASVTCLHPVGDIAVHHDRSVNDQTLSAGNGADGPSYDSRHGLNGFDVLAFVLILAMGVCTMLQPRMINDDAAMYLHCGQFILDGQLPYLDFIELNPPFVMYLFAVPAMIAKLVPLDIVRTFFLFVTLYTAGMYLVMRRGLSRTGIAAGHLSLILLMWVAYSMWELEKFEFGKKEHLFVLLYLPGFLLRWRRWEGYSIGRIEAVVLGLLAGAAVCMKPHFLIIALLPELYWLLIHRRLRAVFVPEVFALAAVGAVYLASLLLMPAAQKTVFFDELVPLVAQGYDIHKYASLREFFVDNFLFSTYRSVQRAIPSLLGIGALFAFLVRPARDERVWSLARPLACLMIGALIVYTMQMRGWPQHYSPALAAGLMLGAIYICAVRFVAPGDADGPGYHWIVGRRAAWTIAIIVVVVGCTAMITRRLKNPPFPYVDDFVRAIESDSQDGDAVAFVSASVLPQYPSLLLTDRRPGFRYLWSFPIAMFYEGATTDADGGVPYHRAEEQSPEEKRFLGRLAEDIAERQPALIFVDGDGWCSGCPDGFNITVYLETIGFVDAHMPGYRRAGIVGGFTRYIRASQVPAEALP